MTPAPRPRLGYFLKLAGVLLGILVASAAVWEIAVVGISLAGTGLRTFVLGLLAFWLYFKGRGAESPATHGDAAVARQELADIAQRHRDLEIAATEPSTIYASSTDAELADVYGAIDKSAAPERFAELIAEIRRRVA